MGRGASSNSIPEIEDARFLFVIGSNTTEAHPVLALRIKKAVRNGATLVVADPRKIWLTKLAKRHLQLRPGTDVWLLNAMMHTILAEGLQDEAYVSDCTEDFEALREVVMRYTPEEAERFTGVPAEAIRATAREYASERHAAIRVGAGEEGRGPTEEVGRGGDVSALERADARGSQPEPGSGE